MRYWFVAVLVLLVPWLSGCVSEGMLHKIVEPPSLPPCMLDLDRLVLDVGCDVFGLAIEKLPEETSETTELSLYGWWGGEDDPCWYGPNCPEFLPYYDGQGNWVGAVSPTLPENGTFRLGCGRTNMVDGVENPDDPDWCLPLRDLAAQGHPYVLEFEECGLTKTNICIGRTNGRSHDALADCRALYINPLCP